jgi:hypothetical protein
MGNKKREKKALAENGKMFVWMDPCKKGKPLDDQFTLAYKTFCNQMDLNMFDPQSQVVRYPLENGQQPLVEHVEEYLKKTHVEEVNLQPTKTSSGPKTTVISVREGDWCILPGGSYWG